MKIDFNRDWSWRRYDETEARPVHLPHDAMLTEPRRKCLNGANSGYFPGGRYIYEKKFTVKKDWLSQQVVLFFEGVYRCATVYVNGEKLCRHDYGYTEFKVDITAAVHEGENTVTVDADNSLEPNSRWYSGSGIYRPVALLVRSPEHIGQVRISTKSIVPAVVTVTCDRDARVEIFDGEQLVASGSCGDLVIPDAKLWSDETPHLYRAVLTTDKDRAEERFGIRSLSVSGSTGLLVNGRQMKLRGACIHHDNGVLGACEFEDAAYRRIAILKKAGYNAIRSAHNPCSRAILRACDELGMFVMDESFDMWYTPKTYHDYSRDFYENYKADIAAMVEKDYNHPSVIMYSIGNENSEPGTDRGMALAREQAEFVRSLDPGRIVTMGANLMLMVYSVYKDDGKPYERKPLDPSLSKDLMGNLDKQGSAGFNIAMGLLPTLMLNAARGKKCGEKAAELSTFLDVVGLNYGTARYKTDLSRFPERIYCGSETFTHQIVENWELVKKFPNLIGDFVWTGWDYLGEAGSCGAWDYLEWGSLPLLDGVGTCDITGLITPQAIYSQIEFGLFEGPYIAVRPVNYVGHKYQKGAWRMTNAVRSWSWQGCEGKKAPVEVYADAHSVEIFLNGKLLGRKKLKNKRCEFSVPYAPGELSARAYDADGRLLGEDRLVTAGITRKLTVTAEQTLLRADGQSLSFVNIEITDENGSIQPVHDVPVTVELEGEAVTLAGLGSARSRTDEVFCKKRHLTHFGRAQAVLRAGYKPGSSVIKVSAPQMETVSVEIIVE